MAGRGRSGKLGQVGEVGQVGEAGAGQHWLWGSVSSARLDVTVWSYADSLGSRQPLSVGIPTPQAQDPPPCRAGHSHMWFCGWRPVSSSLALAPRGRSRPPLHRAHDPWPPGWGYPRPITGIIVDAPPCILVLPRMGPSPGTPPPSCSEPSRLHVTDRGKVIGGLPDVVTIMEGKVRPGSRARSQGLGGVGRARRSHSWVWGICGGDCVLLRAQGQ